MNEKTQSQQNSTPPPKRRLKRWLTWLVIIFFVLPLLGGGLVGVAEYRTSQPDFCASCHIMIPYYESWEADIHGKKLDIACVECHYAPGERTTIKAKLRGLSQVASYFSGRYGASRPRAHVSNDSCLTSKCHGDFAFMDKPLQMGTVKFTHANHMRRTEEQEQPHVQRLAELRTSLKEMLGEERFAELENTATRSDPAAGRYAAMADLMSVWNVTAERETLIEFSQLLHREVRLAQLNDLQCTNCHSYHSQPDGDDPDEQRHHFKVSMTSCYTCHFNNEGFNVGTASCLMCHTPPQTEITVHEPLAEPASQELDVPELREKPVKMNHAEIVARNVDCVACHADVAREDSTVTRRDCERCHDQARFFADWQEPLSLDLVAKYHKAHVQQQRAKCLDCHSEIQHGLVRDPDHPGDFLTAALSNCTACHPNHHREQVLLLTGLGGNGVSKSAPNPMFGARTNCYGCHIEQGGDSREEQVSIASRKTCVACHSERYGDMFEKWKLGVEFTLEDAENAYQEAESLLQQKTDAPAEAREKAAALLKLAKADLQLVKRGNGIHNVTYAIDLLDSVTAHCREATAALNGE